MSNLAEFEIFRLRKLGWDPGEIDHQKVWHKLRVSPVDISFPKAAYSALSIDQISRDPWEIHRAREIGKIIKKNGHNLIWEIGAGNGSVSEILQKNGIEVICVEPIYDGAKLLSVNSKITYCATLDGLLLPDNSINAIGMFDVLEHINNPEETVAEIYRVLAPGGLFICTVPAYNFLFSDFDLALGHFRRYSRKSLKELILTRDFKEISTIYLFSILVLPAFFLRTLPYNLGRRNSYTETKKNKGTETNILSKISTILGLWFRLETALRIPTGLSILSSWQKDLA